MLRNTRSLASLTGLAVLILVGVLFVAGSTANAQPTRIILHFQTMYGVDGPFVGTDNPIRDVNGDGLPWEIEKFISGTLDSKGNLTILGRGLVIKDDPSVPANLRGKNPSSEFRGLVSCLTEESEDEVGMDNVITEGFPADEDGNSFINAKIELPNPCVAPIIMVLNKAGSARGDRWFAVTGFEAEED